MDYRNAEIKDRSALVELWNQFMLELHGALPSPEERAVWEMRLDAQLARDQVYMANDDSGQIAGFCGFIDHTERAFVPEGVAYLVDIYVLPEQRKSGIASGLLRFSLERLGLHGCDSCWTNTHIDNHATQKCLQNVGFKPLTGFSVPGLSDHIYLHTELG